MSVATMPKTDEDADAATPRDKKKLIAITLVAVMVMAGAGWFLFLKPGLGAHQAPEPGQVLGLESIQVNLSGGNYLKLGIALQLTVDVKEAPDGSKALDAAIDLFSGRSMVELVRPGQRDKLKEELANELKKLYDGEVIAIYFTDFVTQ